ncbi:MAG: cell division protein FtsQ/DivIB [Gaiellaceae bacterium]
MPAKARSRRPAARAETATLPRRRRAGGHGTSLVRRLAPSRRSLLVGLGIVAVALCSYAIARETSIFAIGKIDVRGGSSQVDAQVQQVLRPLVGRSLVGLDGGDVLRRVDALPTVVSATYDRAFPSTLRIVVVPERPVVVLRSGAAAWLVSTHGRVIATLAAQVEPGLPRIWLGAKQKVSVGELLPSAVGAVARTLGSAGVFRSRVATASLVAGSVVFRLRSGVELLLGKPAGIPLKVAVAARVLDVLPTGSRFLDVSVPGRPVAGSKIPTSTRAKSSSRG